MKRIYKYAFWITLTFFLLTVTLFFTNVFPGFSIKEVSRKPGALPKTDAPLIQIALLLDTSSSMSGLIEQAKAYLWKMVNELAASKKDDKTPELHVALYEYGKNSLSPFSGYIREVVPFTQDLDHLYEELFYLSTNGGDEYCGLVMDRAIHQLQWSTKRDDLRFIFIAGNESFNQGNVSYKEVCSRAQDRNIIINTIHCGGYEEGINGFWKDGAERGKGKYMIIDQNQEIVHIQAPQDDDITRLNEELNNTYIPYGSEGAQLKTRQATQDSNALSMNREILIQRAATKSTKTYKNESWDMVDAVENNKLSYEQINDRDLPEEMQGMTKEERKNYIEGLSKKREEIQDKIMELYKERETYISEQKKLNEKDTSLGDVIITALREQAETNGFVFEK
ncbi:MAG: VWA domain-containing protein [Spirochaetales bacterium]|nr:VWA domain-containing protein [Spirochaetales bacterium]